MKKISEVMEKVDQSGVDDEAIQTAMLPYIANLKTYKGVMKNLGDPKEAVRKVYFLEEEEDVSENDVKEYCKSVVENHAPKLTVMGIVEGWKSPEINQGTEGFLVTKYNPMNPYDESGKESIINMFNVEQAQLNEKIKHALQERSDKSFALIVTGAEHWALLAIDPLLKQYRLIDSYARKMNDYPKDFKTKLDTALSNEYTELPPNDVKQQYDDSECGIWVLKNCQHIQKNGIGAPIADVGKDNFKEQVLEMRGGVMDHLTEIAIRCVREEQGESSLNFGAAAHIEHSTQQTHSSLEDEDEPISLQKISV